MNKIFKDILLDYITFINYFRTQPDEFSSKNYKKPTKYTTMYGVIATVAFTLMASLLIHLIIGGKEPDINPITVIILAFVLPYGVKGLAKNFVALSEFLHPILNEYLSPEVKAEVGLMDVKEDTKNRGILCIFRGQYIGVIPLKGYEIDIVPYIMHFLHEHTGVSWTLESQSYEPELLKFTNDGKLDLTIFVQFTDQVEKMRLVKIPMLKGNNK